MFLLNVQVAGMVEHVRTMVPTSINVYARQIMKDFIVNRKYAKMGNSDAILKIVSRQQEYVMEGRNANTKMTR